LTTNIVLSTAIFSVKETSTQASTIVDQFTRTTTSTSSDISIQSVISIITFLDTQTIEIVSTLITSSVTTKTSTEWTTSLVIFTSTSTIIETVYDPEVLPLTGTDLRISFTTIWTRRTITRTIYTTATTDSSWCSSDCRWPHCPWHCKNDVESQLPAQQDKQKSYHPKDCEDFDDNENFLLLGCNVPANQAELMCESIGMELADVYSDSYMEVVKLLDGKGAWIRSWEGNEDGCLAIQSPLNRRPNGAIIGTVNDCRNALIRPLCKKPRPFSSFVDLLANAFTICPFSLGKLTLISTANSAINLAGLCSSIGLVPAMLFATDYGEATLEMANCASLSSLFYIGGFNGITSDGVTISCVLIDSNLSVTYITTSGALRCFANLPGFCASPTPANPTTQHTLERVCQLYLQPL
jgi:hypothetical protein